MCLIVSYSIHAGAGAQLRPPCSGIAQSAQTTADGARDLCYDLRHNQPAGECSHITYLLSKVNIWMLRQVPFLGIGGWGGFGPPPPPPPPPPPGAGEGLGGAPPPPPPPLIGGDGLGRGRSPPPLTDGDGLGGGGSPPLIGGAPPPLGGRGEGIGGTPASPPGGWLVPGVHAARQWFKLAATSHAASYTDDVEQHVVT
jgi:hypothetical protein